MQLRAEIIRGFVKGLWVVAALVDPLQGQAEVFPSRVVTVGRSPVLRIPVEQVPDRPMVGVILPERLIHVVTRNGQVLQGYDSTGRQRFRHQITPGGGGFGFFFNVFRDRTGRVFVWDNVLNRLVSLSEGGQLVAQRRIGPLPSVPVSGGGRIAQSLNVYGTLESGELIATTTSEPSARAEIGLDSVQVIAVGRSGQAVPIGAVLLGHRYVRRDQFVIQGTVPFGRVGRIAVGSGVWYYTGGERFAIERRDRTGSLLRTFGVNRQRRPVDSIAVATFRGTAGVEIDPVLKPTMNKVWAWMPYPDSMPAYSDLHVDPRGMLWVRVYAPTWERGIWDLFTPTGEYLGEVSIPASVRVLSVGEDALLGLAATGPGTGELRVYSIDRRQ